MNISHWEVEIVIRPIDRRNAPIVSKNVFFHSRTTEDLLKWLKYSKLLEAYNITENLAKLVANKPDPYGIESTNKTADQTTKGQSDCAQTR